MGKETNLLIRDSIVQAHNEELQTHSLQCYLESRSLHRSISLPGDNTTEALVNFLERYINHVPDFLDALIDVSKAAGIYPFISKIIHVAQSFFISPPELLNDHKGLLALVDEAYLAHRLMEEVNDQIMMRCGIPLIPMDLTVSNLIVHSLLDEQFANQLDMAVMLSMDTLFEDFTGIEHPEFKTYIATHKLNGWEEIVQEWPCLAGDSAITLDLLNESDDAISVH